MLLDFIAREDDDILASHLDYCRMCMAYGKATVSAYDVQLEFRTIFCSNVTANTFKKRRNEDTD